MQQLKQEATVPEYADAFRSIRMAKFWLTLTLFLTLAAFIATFCLVQWTVVLDTPAAEAVVVKPTNVPAATAPATAPAPAAPAPAPAPAPKAPEWVVTTKFILSLALPALKFLGFVAAILLALTLLIGFKVSLIGQLGGVSYFVSAFFWSLVLLFFMTPWDQLSATAFTGEYIGLFTRSIDSIRPYQAELFNRMDKISASVQYYGKFLAWPALAFLVWLIVLVKFAKGYNRLNFPTAISGSTYRD